MPKKADSQVLRYSMSLVTQGKYRFFTLTMPSSVLKDTCFVTTREDNPMKGFQRTLDTKRAQEIADYIDSGLGTIPNSIVLSAQAEADLKVIRKGVGIQFRNIPKAFLVLDGQHRIYGFALAKTELRVPVVIYNGLSRKEETRLFIDINTKQRPVPNELLLDIKSLAEYESDEQQIMREVFDYFSSETNSILYGLLSPSSRVKGRISRVTFNAAIKTILHVFSATDTLDIYDILNSYLTAFDKGLSSKEISSYLTNPVVFRAVISLFTDVGQRVKDKFGANYSVDNFSEILEPMFNRLPPQRISNPGNSYKALQKHFINSLKTEFTV